MKFNSRVLTHLIIWLTHFSLLSNNINVINVKMTKPTWNSKNNVMMTFQLLMLRLQHLKEERLNYKVLLINSRKTLVSVTVNWRLRTLLVRMLTTKLLPLMPSVRRKLKSLSKNAKKCNSQLVLSRRLSKSFNQVSRALSFKLTLNWTHRFLFKLMSTSRRLRLKLVIKKIKISIKLNKDSTNHSVISLVILPRCQPNPKVLSLYRRL